MQQIHSLVFNLFSGEDGLQWQSSDGGWVLHVISAVNEWLLGLVFIMFILTFVEEFKRFTIDSTQKAKSENLARERANSAWDDM